MIKLSKKIITFFFLLCLLLAVICLVSALYAWNNINIFEKINSCFLPFLTAVVFLGTYDYHYKESKGYIASPFLTLGLLCIGVIIFALFLIKLRFFGFQSAILFEQISIFVLAGAGLGGLINIHVKRNINLKHKK